MDDKIKKMLVAVVIIALMCATAFLCCRNRADVFDDRGRADDTREQLERACDNQRGAEEELDAAADTATDIGGEITSIREKVHEARVTTDELKADNDRAGQLTRECTEILERVSGRGESQTGKD